MAEDKQQLIVGRAVNLGEVDRERLLRGFRPTRPLMTDALKDAILGKPRSISPEILVKDAWIDEPLRLALKLNPKTDFGRAAVEIVKHLKDTPYARDAALELLNRLASVTICESRLFVRIHRGALWLANNSGPAIEDHGMVGYRVVTTVGAGFIVDALQNILEAETMKFHGIGTGSGAEAIGDTTLGTELTTEYSPNSTRATGTLTEGATGNIFRTVATNTLDATPGGNIQEHGLFSNATVGSGVLFDRTKFASGGYALVSGDGLETPYEWTMAIGG